MQVKIATMALLLLTCVSGKAQMSPFAPLETWKAAVVSGDQAALEKLYSTNPPAAIRLGKDAIAVRDECAYWAGLKRSGMTQFIPRLLEVIKENGNIRLQLRISITSKGANLLAGTQQMWVHQADGWKIVASDRSEFNPEATRTLPQPAVPNVSLYSEPREAEPELRAGLAEAAKNRKRVLVVFGGNWCYDCHVLDTTFRSKEFAALVNANYIVVHINIGDEGKDNNELAARLGVVLDKGVPSLGVLEPDGKVVYAQKNGEFESTVKIGPDDVRAFLEKWKPAR